MSASSCGLSGEQTCGPTAKQNWSDRRRRDERQNRNTSRAREKASTTRASRSEAANATVIKELVYLGGGSATSAARALLEEVCAGVPHDVHEPPGGRRHAPQPFGYDLCAASVATVAKTGKLV